MVKVLACLFFLLFCLFAFLFLFFVVDGVFLVWFSWGFFLCFVWFGCFVLSPGSDLFVFMNAFTAFFINFFFFFLLCLLLFSFSIYFVTSMICLGTYMCVCVHVCVCMFMYIFI